MAESEHPARKPMIATGIVIGLIIAGLFCWLFATFESLSITAGAVLVAFILLAGWTVFSGVHYGPTDSAHDNAGAH